MKKCSVLFVIVMILGIFSVALANANVSITPKTKTFSLEQIVEKLEVKLEINSFGDTWYEFVLPNLPKSWQIEKGEIKAVPLWVSFKKWAEIPPWYYNSGMYSEGNSIEITLLWTEKIFNFDNKKLKIPVRLIVRYHNLSESEIDALFHFVKNAIKKDKKIKFNFDFYCIWPKVSNLKKIDPCLGITIEFLKIGL